MSCHHPVQREATREVHRPRRFCLLGRSQQFQAICSWSTPLIEKVGERLASGVTVVWLCSQSQTALSSRVLQCLEPQSRLLRDSAHPTDSPNAFSVKNPDWCDPWCRSARLAPPLLPMACKLCFYTVQVETDLAQMISGFLSDLLGGTRVLPTPGHPRNAVISWRIC